ncbi:MAG: DUF4153 domain-containing protein [Muribaculaceae bacterium]|nr:DUF4153 domain-containing protein [Muribaculaceae bacterium]
MKNPPDFTPPATDGKPRRLISLHTLIQAFNASADRFPLSLAYLLAFAVWGLVTIWIPDMPENSFFIRNVRPAVWFLLSTGILLSLAVSLWCEQSGKQRLHTPAQWVGNIILLLDFTYVLLRINTFSTAEYIAQSSIFTALVVAVLFVPSRRHTPPRHSLMFSLRQAGNLLESLGIALGMGFVVGIINLTVNILFSYYDYRIFASLAFLFSASLSILIFIGRIPDFNETVEMVRKYEPTKFIAGVIKYILLPVVAIYTVILYVYGIKIIIAQELPDGGICAMVSALTAGIYVLLFLLKAIASSSQGEDRLTQLSLRIFPLVLIPLLVMMSVAIGVRIGQYGTTVARLYVLTFNIWAYVTAIYLYFTASRNTNIVALSFAVVFLLTSIIPGANYTTLVHRHMRSEIFKAFSEANVKQSQYPLSMSDFEVALQNMDEATAEDVKAKLCYLDSYDNHSSVDDIIGFEIWESTYRVSPTFRPKTDQEYTEDDRIKLKFGSENRSLAIPAGYTHVRNIFRYNSNIAIPESGIITLELRDNIYIPLDFNKVKSLKSDTINEPIRIERQPDSLYIISSIDYRLKHYSDSTSIETLEIDGMLFTR